MCKCCEMNKYQFIGQILFEHAKDKVISNDYCGYWVCSLVKSYGCSNFHATHPTYLAGLQYAKSLIQNWVQELLSKYEGYNPRFIANKIITKYQLKCSVDTMEKIVNKAIASKYQNDKWDLQRTFEEQIRQLKNDYRLKWGFTPLI